MSKIRNNSFILATLKIRTTGPIEFIIVKHHNKILTKFSVDSEPNDFMST